MASVERPEVFRNFNWDGRLNGGRKQFCPDAKMPIFREIPSQGAPLAKNQSFVSHET